ncbi:MAG: aldehyde dehydrogenase family protein [Actinomycetota bacterium]
MPYIKCLPTRPRGATVEISANTRRFYINGQWVDPSTDETLAVINPATEQPIASIAMGGTADVDDAVAAAQSAFESWSRSSVDERTALLGKITELLGARSNDLAEIISAEMGAPGGLAKAAQAPTGMAHFGTMAAILPNFEFETAQGKTLLVREPVGVVGMITPWNWPLNQIACKVAPALAAGCTMVLKPSEVAPLNALLFAEILDEAGVPAGVFNLVNGDGPTVGAHLSAHPGVDMMSFTGSTRAGVEVARNAAPTVKRVAQELGGKSANIILDDADVAEAVRRDAFGMCTNSGQSCNAGTRMLIPNSAMEEAKTVAKSAMDAVAVGDPTSDGVVMGPVVSEVQWNKIQDLIQAGIDEGAELVTGGVGRPEGLESGYFVRPTLFANVTNDMRIAQEEIFGPVLVLIGYEDDDDAVRIANETVYGLAGYVSGSQERALGVARRIRTGNVHVNGAGPDFNAPFGGYKQSGNGREWGAHGLEEFLETKAILGAATA